VDIGLSPIKEEDNQDKYSELGLLKQENGDLLLKLEHFIDLQQRTENEL
jgi:hypothetical protein